MPTLPLRSDPLWFATPRMGDFFFSKLPVGHAIRTMTRAAASASLQQEAAMGSDVAASADGARQQCAAMAWALSDVYSVSAVRKLPSAARVYLLQLFGLSVSPRSASAQADRIEAHRTLHHPELAGNDDADGAGGGGGNGGGDNGGSGGGAAGAGPQGDPSIGFSSALLPAGPLAALQAISIGELRRLLDAAGVPHDLGSAVSSVRMRGAAAAWAAEKLRTLDDVRALPDTIRSQMIDCFDIPAAWKSEARLQALLVVLQSCRNSPWSIDPGLSCGLVDRTRSELFRFTERLTAAKPEAHSAPDQILSASEQVQLRTSLAAAGYSDKDLVFSQGRWALGSPAASGVPGPNPATGPDTAEAVKKIEAELRTLHVSAYTLLTAAERKDQATRTKTAPGLKRKAAYPGDTETDCPDYLLNPFAEWPWEQELRVTPDLPYRRAGRMLKNALRWVNKFCTCPVMKMTHATRSLHSDTLFEQFNDAIASHSLDRALLIASQAVAEATEQMQCILVNAQARAALHSTSAFLTHVAARRQSQSTDLKIFLAELTGRITDASKAPGASSGAATAAWIDFLTGWLSKVDTDLVEPESILQASQSSPASASSPTPRSSNSTGGTPRSVRQVTFSPGTSGGQGPASGSGGAGGGGGGNISGASSSPSVKIWNVCKFRRNIPCSAEIIGDSLGVTSAPPCTLCHQGSHYHGECPTKWGGSGTALPGFAADGQRLPGCWKDNEPIRRIVKGWVDFLKDHSHFNNHPPSPAGAAGAPGLAEFEARVPLAPKKP